MHKEGYVQPDIFDIGRFQLDLAHKLFTVEPRCSEQLGTSTQFIENSTVYSSYGF